MPTVDNFKSRPKTIAFLGNYLPRKCGIATFTSDLLEAVDRQYEATECIAVAVNDVATSYRYPSVVRFQIDEHDQLSYLRAADFLNASGVDVVSVQHEFGIFGGVAGGYLIPLLRALTVPVVTTLHTVLRNPNEDQRRVMRDLIAYSARIVVMTERGQTILREVYDVAPDKIDIIPHGIPDIPFAAPSTYKQRLGLAGKHILLTFGLLSPNKGIEHVLNALPGIVQHFPNVVYVVLGATHPHELRTHGEAYRLGLEAIVKQHGLEANVIFHNRFVELRELTEWIGAADLYITPYVDESQSTSGTLAYAFGAGKAVISTPYWHAAELLAGDRGVIVPFADPHSIAREAEALLRDEQRRTEMGDKAFRLGRSMVWSNTGALYCRSFERARRIAPGLPAPLVAESRATRDEFDLPALNLGHLHRMTDAVGVFQHATHDAPNLAEGYCTDDNARALIAATWIANLDDAPAQAQPLAATYFAFLANAFNAPATRFHNFLDRHSHWLDEYGSEDCHGRAIWALGVAAAHALDRRSRERAEQLLMQALPAVADFTSPRAWAFSLIGIDENRRQLNHNRLLQYIRADLVERLVALFDATEQPDWMWFEESLTYDNAKLAHALIVSGRAMNQEHVFRRGLRALRWLVSVQTSEFGQLRPIGSNGFYQHNGARAHFDQQPIEAQATVSACLAAYRATSDPWWRDRAQIAFDWFLGWNDLGAELYRPRTGGCRDGLHADRCNENQGAESTLAFLLALAEMRLAPSLTVATSAIGSAVSAT